LLLKIPAKGQHLVNYKQQSVPSDEALYRTLDYTISYLASGVSVSYLQKCQLYEA